MVFARPFISKFSSHFINPWMSASRAPITLGINVTFLFHGFFQFPSKVVVLILHFTFFQFYSVVSRDSKVHNSARSLFLLIIIRSCRLAEILWAVCISKCHSSLSLSFSRIDAGLWIYHFFLWSNPNFLHNSQWITFPPSSCLVLNSFCANVLHSIKMWSFGLYHHIISICFFVISSFDMIVSYDIAIWRDAVSHVRCCLLVA